MDRILQHSTESYHFKLLRAECLALLGRYQEAQEPAKYAQIKIKLPFVYIKCTNLLLLSLK